MCEYSHVASAGASGGLAFSNGYRSDLLTHFLNFVIAHRSLLDRSPGLNRDSLVQVQLPNEDEKLRALKFVNEVQTNVLHRPTALGVAT